MYVTLGQQVLETKLRWEGGGGLHLGKLQSAY